MSLVHIGLILLFLILFATGLLVMIRSKSISNWIFNWSARFLKEFGDIPNPEKQRETSLWVIRIFGFMLIFSCIVFIYFLFTDIHW